MKYMFTAKWCNQCAIVKPFVDTLDVEIIDIEEAPGFVSKYGIMSLPVYLIDDKNGVRFKTGLLPNDSIKEFYEQ